MRPWPHQLIPEGDREEGEELLRECTGRDGRGMQMPGAASYLNIITAPCCKISNLQKDACLGNKGNALKSGNSGSQDKL